MIYPEIAGDAVDQELLDQYTAPYEIGNLGNSNGVAIDCKMNEKKGTAICVVTISKGDKTIKRFALTLPLGQITRKIMQYLIPRAQVSGANVGNWDSIKRKAKRAAKKLASKKFHQQIDKILNDPAIKTNIMLASTIYPPLGITYHSIQQSSGVLLRAREGDPEAQQKIIELAAMAGDPNHPQQAQAQKYASAIVMLNQLAKQGGPVAVQGWLYNLPYRNPLLAKSLDTSNPFHAMRSMYHEGMTLGMK